ncbi:MAG TPA: Gmad2 immunoglobulin-like domain-containing protein [Candidatus Paceibacterota bacterium]|nr:Gmad2 immunoglobulin-like domain-containing protein [Candidatus Paceibacterota bacterium]
MKTRLVVVFGAVLVIVALVIWAVFFYGFPKAGQNGKYASSSPASSSASSATSSNETTTHGASVASLADCVAAGYPVVPGPPRQCTTPDGRRYAEEIPEKATYQNATADMITVALPSPGAVVGKDFKVKGQARGGWYFEGSFPVTLLDKNGKTLVSGVVQAQGEWMTENFVPFEVDLKAPDSYIGPATLVLKKDNPSGLPQNDASVSLPITVEY